MTRLLLIFTISIGTSLSALSQKSNLISYQITDILIYPNGEDSSNHEHIESISNHFILLDCKSNTIMVLIPGGRSYYSLDNPLSINSDVSNEDGGIIFDSSAKYYVKGEPQNIILPVFRTTA